MERMLKVPLSLMVLVLSVFLVAGTASAKSCPTTLTSADCGCVADIPNQTYTLAEDMICSTRHGIIIGAEGVTIDGAGYKLDGGGVSGRHCAVLTEPASGDDPGWCVGHPCRAAADTECRSGAGEGDCCIDSGILNARGTDGDGNLAGGCNSSAPACQGGCNKVTIKNLEITGWCTGIFMSGDCAEGSERRLTGILIEGNYIHDNGNGDCGSYTCYDSDHGAWTNTYYNDAIFLAEVGISAFEPGVAPPCIECEKGSTECPDLVEQAWNSCYRLSSMRNIIRGNRIENQKGCGTISCPGGNGINLNGGLELEPYTNVVWAGCNDIYNNRILNCDMSGIQYQHATIYNRIHDNYCSGNKLGGITDACSWCHENYVYDNTLVENGAMGIGVNAGAMITNNVSILNEPVGSTLQPLCTCHGYPCDGIGIALGADACSDPGDEFPGRTSKVFANTAWGNASADIQSPILPEGIHDGNFCGTTGGAYYDTNAFNGGSPGAGGCQYNWLP